MIFKKTSKFCNYHCLFSREAAIEQFRKGVASICSSIIEKPCCFKKYFVQNQTNTTLEELRVNLKLVRSSQGTNAYEKEEDTLIEVDLFLLSMESLNNDVKVKDFLQFFNFFFKRFSSRDWNRIPVMGLTKPIEVFFTHENRYPKASTCGLTLTLSYNVRYVDLFSEKWRNLWWSLISFLKVTNSRTFLLKSNSSQGQPYPNLVVVYNKS